MILEFFSIIYKTNDPQIFHLQKKLWVYKLFMMLGHALGLFSAMHPQWSENKGNVQYWGVVNDDETVYKNACS